LKLGEDDEALHAIAVGDAAWWNRPHGGSTRGITSVIKIDEVIFGHLTELNGKFKLRATELTFAPDGYVRVHDHVGPGIRYVISGELTFAEGGQETSIKLASTILRPGTSKRRSAAAH
jgi:quercetin dioxygenase-like cupin family protein